MNNIYLYSHQAQLFKNSIIISSFIIVFVLLFVSHPQTKVQVQYILITWYITLKEIYGSSIEVISVPFINSISKYDIVLHLVGFPITLIQKESGSFLLKYPAMLSVFKLDFLPESKTYITVI